MNNTFATAINCMDGRVQLSVNNYIQNKTQSSFVDTITLAGPSRVIATEENKDLIKNLKFRLDISINQHGSKYIAVVGHYDCAGVPENDDLQKEYIIQSSIMIKNWYPNVQVEALWCNASFDVELLR